MAPNPPRERDIEEDDDILGTEKKPDATSMLAEDDDDEEGPDNAEVRREQARKPPAREEREEDDERLAYDDGDDDGDEIGTGRRARRNRAKRRREEQAQQHIASLTNTVVTLQKQLEGMSRGQLSLAAGDIDGQIAQLQGHLDSFEAAHAAAVTAGDGPAATKALRLSREAESRLASLAYERRRLEAAASQRPPQEQEQRPQPQARGGNVPNPSAARHAERFMERNAWFDPDDPTDEDSQIAKAIEDALANEGSLPSSKQHWIEFERRCKARGLGKNGDDMREDDDDAGERRPAQRQADRNGGLPPRSRRGAGGRGAGSGDFKLTTFMRETLDAEGLAEERGLTEDQVKLRRKYIKTWREGFENAARSGSVR